MAWTQTLSGKAFDLSQPDASMVDFENDVAPALAKLARFTGHTNGDLAYSVAQHCVLGAESMYAQHYDDTVADQFQKTGANQATAYRLAALFLLHDAHEAFIGDIPTPVAQTLRDSCGAHFYVALHDLKSSIDLAIHVAADFAPPDWDEHAIIKRHDVAMMNAERLALLQPAPRSWGAAIDAVPPAILAEPIEPWPAWAAQEEWLQAFTRFVVGNGA